MSEHRVEVKSSWQVIVDGEEYVHRRAVDAQFYIGLFTLLLMMAAAAYTTTRWATTTAELNRVKHQACDVRH